MSNALLAFLVAVSASAWIYSKLMKTTGGNTKSALTGAAVSSVLIFVLVLIIANMVM